MNRALVNELGEVVRVAFSYREKVARLRSNADALLASGVLERSRYEALQADYAPHVQQAVSAVAAALNRVRRAHGRTAQHQERVEKRLAAIRNEAAHGGDAARLNAEHRRVLAQLEEARSLREGLAALAQAQDAEAAGGFVDRPLDGYAAAFTAESITPPWRKAWPGAAAAGAALFSLLLPWLWGAAPQALAFGFLDALSRLSDAPAPQWSDAASVAFVLLPLLAAALLYAAWTSLWACWGAVGCGMLMIASACLPAGWMATRTFAVAPTAPDAFAATGPGAWLYGAAGFAVVVLAVFAMDRRRGSARLRLLDVLLMAALALSIFLGLGVLLAYGGEELPVQADIAVETGSARLVSTLTNRGRFTATVGLLGPVAGSDQHAVAAVVSIRDGREGPWDVVLPPREAWRLLGSGHEAGRLELLPRSTQRVELDAGVLADAVGPCAEVRLEWRSEGAVLARADLPMEAAESPNPAP